MQRCVGCRCETTAGNEGGWTSQASLRGGGTITKVLRHGDLAHELRNVSGAFWVRWLRQADDLLPYCRRAYVL